MAIVVVAVAYSTSAPSLGIAEFAPTARQTVEPPTTAADANGDGVGGRGRNRSTSTTSPPSGSSDATGDPARPTTTVGRGRLCYGEPPRQLPDPRSPACHATVFEGDNGGATATGVTATEIRVMWPLSSGLAGGAQGERERGGVQAIFDHFNRNFEFYGRRLVPVPVIQSGNDAPGQRAYAAELAGMGPFAVLEPPVGTTLPSFFAELARLKVLTIGIGAWTQLSDREAFDPLHPYLWSVYPSLEQTWANLADFSCTALAGRKATHAGPSLQGENRKFGVLAAGAISTPSIRKLVEGLRACGVEPMTAQWLQQNDSNGGRTALEGFRNGGVTTLICACANVSNYSVSSTLQGMGWTDVELLAPYETHPSLEEARIQNMLSADQRVRLFGLGATNRVAPVQSQWASRAMMETREDLALNPGRYAEGAYEQLLILAAGIQAAGPNLTVESFSAGLMSTQFANTGAGQAPYWLPSVGFGPGDHTFTNDFTVVWWSESADAYGSTDGVVARPKGSWCYLDRGARYGLGRFPSDADARIMDPAAPCR